MDRITFIEYVLGGSNMYIRAGLLLLSWTVYTIVLKRILRIPILIGGPISLFIAAIFPLTLSLPLYLVLWTAYRILKIFFGLLRIPKTQNVKERVHDESFSFDVDGKTIVLDNPYRGIYVQGGAGSGKSVSLVYPILKQAIEKNYSGICYDFKSPELANFIFQQASKRKSEVKPYFIDFKDARRSIQINPLDPRLMTKTAYANEYAQTLMYNLSPNNIKNENYWIMEAKSVLTGLIWYLKTDHPEYCTLPHIISLLLH